MLFRASNIEKIYGSVTFFLQNLQLKTSFGKYHSFFSKKPFYHFTEIIYRKLYLFNNQFCTVLIKHILNIFEKKYKYLIHHTNKEKTKYFINMFNLWYILSELIYKKDTFFLISWKKQHLELFFDYTITINSLPAQKTLMVIMYRK